MILEKSWATSVDVLLSSCTLPQETVLPRHSDVTPELLHLELLQCVRAHFDCELMGAKEIVLHITPVAICCKI